MTALVISISSDLSVESVGSSFLRVILIDSIFVEVLVAPEVGAAVVASPVRVLEFDTYSSLEADPSESSLPPISVAPMVLPFLSSDDLEEDIPIGQRYRTNPSRPCKALTARKLVRPLSSYRLALRSALLSTMYPPMTFESLAGDSSFESSVGPSRKRYRSHAATVNSSIHALRALVPSRTDLLLSRKRFRDSISQEDSVTEDIDTDALGDIEADATAVKVVVDRDVKARVDAGIGLAFHVGVDVEDEVEDEVESSDK
nr:hypothetical protein [Tanacetum cinerariifolium]